MPMILTEDHRIKRLREANAGRNAITMAADGIERVFYSKDEMSTIVAVQKAQETLSERVVG